MNKTATGSYALRINRVIDYINTHLQEDLSLEQLSQVANFSKYHFHRQFSEYTGITVSKLVQLMRLKRASYQLVFNKPCRIIDIALDAGFENPESFSRAFKKAHGQTPSEFRKEPAWKPWLDHYQIPSVGGKSTMQVKIVDFEETRVAALEHRGPFEHQYNSIKIFIEWRKESQLAPIDSSKTFNIFYDDPKTTAREEYRFDICASIESKVVENSQGVIEKTISGGRCAVLRHIGSTDNLGKSIGYLYSEWLPASGEEIRDYPLFCHRLEVGIDVLEHQQITDIYMPLL